jgi:hypothetical protein
MTKNTTPHESWEQQSLVAELERLEPGILIEAHPIEGDIQSTLLKVKIPKKLAETAARMLGVFARSMGYQAGTLDIFLPEHRIYIELKRQKGGSLSPEQKARIPRLEAAGYRVIVARGAVDAINQLGKLGLFQLTLEQI